MLYEEAAYLQENRNELASLLALPLDGESPCSFLTIEECTVQIIDNIVMLHLLTPKRR
jgi:hypothetical protein